MTDIVEKLNRKGRHFNDPTPSFMTDPLCAEAAAEIERLRAERDALAQTEAAMRRRLEEVVADCERLRERVAEAARWKQYVIDYAPDVADEADAFLTPDSADEVQK